MADIHGHGSGKACTGTALATLGVCADGRRVISDLRLSEVEGQRAWLDAIHSLVARNLGAPMLAVIDGNLGLAAALQTQWLKLALQRCTNHKRWNLLAKAPARLRERLTEDYRRMIYPESGAEVEQAQVGFARNWRLRYKAVASSFEEAGELFTFKAFPISQRKAQRTTNALERINEEFRRRTKTQVATERGVGSAPAVRTPAQRTGQAAPAGRLA